MPKNKFPMGGGMGNINSMLKQAQKMQSDMEKAKELLSEKEEIISAGGGAVTVTITGAKIIKDIAIKPEVVDPDDIEMLQDLLIAAVNEAYKKIEDMTDAEMTKITGGLKLGF